MGARHPRLDAHLRHGEKPVGVTLGNARGTRTSRHRQSPNGRQMEGTALAAHWRQSEDTAHAH